MNWTREELEKNLPNCGKAAIQNKGQCQVETSRPIQDLSQQSITFTQDKDLLSDLEEDDDEGNGTAWSKRFDEDQCQLSGSPPSLKNARPYNIISSNFKQLVAAVKKDHNNLKDCEDELLNLVASVEGKVAKLAKEEEGVLALTYLQKEAREPAKMISIF
jgi:hypothetical protein